MNPKEKIKTKEEAQEQELIFKRSTTQVLGTYLKDGYEYVRQEKVITPIIGAFGLAASYFMGDSGNAGILMSFASKACIFGFTTNIIHPFAAKLVTALEEDRETSFENEKLSCQDQRVLARMRKRAWEQTQKIWGYSPKLQKAGRYYRRNPQKVGGAGFAASGVAIGLDALSGNAIAVGQALWGLATIGGGTGLMIADEAKEKSQEPQTNRSTAQQVQDRYEALKPFGFKIASNSFIAGNVTGASAAISDIINKGNFSTAETIFFLFCVNMLYRFIKKEVDVEPTKIADPMSQQNSLSDNGYRKPKLAQSRETISTR